MKTRRFVWGGRTSVDTCLQLTDLLVCDLFLFFFWLIGLRYLPIVFFNTNSLCVHGVAVKQTHLLIPLLQLLCHVLKMYDRFNLKIFTKSDNELKEQNLMK